MRQLVTATRQGIELLGLHWSQFATSSHVVRSRSRALTCYRLKGGTADMKGTTNNEPLEPLIFTIRGHRVVLDADLARVYGVSTKSFNQAFKRNQHRFPADFSESNWSQTVTSYEPDADSSKGNSSQFAMSSMRHRGKTYRPWAFTEHGALMAANILRSERAVQMSVFVVRAFVRLREEVAANTTVLARLAEIDRKLLQHDVALLDIYQRLLPLLQPSPDPPKRRIGFHADDD